MDFAIVIYSGKIDEGSLDNFDEDMYGDVFKSVTIEKGQRWSYAFNTEDEFSWFSYPGNFSGKVIVSDYKISSANQYIILESDGLESSFAGRVIRVDCWGNILWSFGEGYLVKPRDARPLLNNKVLIST